MFIVADFKKTYINTATGEIVTVHTNHIEGAWKHAKSHFKKCLEPSIYNMKAEVMWRS